MAKDYGMSRSIMQDKDAELCFICNALASDTHHIFGGANRKFSDQDGMTVKLCRHCHTKLHDHATGMSELRSCGQRRWMEYYKKDTNDFRRRYGKSYL